MAIQTEPTRIQIPFADSGTKNTIPATQPTPTASQAASWTDGFPTQCSLPLSAGGIPPARADFNGIFNTMSQSIRFGQEGGIWAWDATVDYAANRLVLGSDGMLYWSVAQSGPNLGGAQDPTADTLHSYWVSPKTATMPTSDVSGCAVNTQWIYNWWSSMLSLTDIYVNSTSGDDSNDGTSAHPFKTNLRAINFLKNSPIKPSYCTIHLAQGSGYTTLSEVPGVDVTYKGEGTGASVDQVYAIGSNTVRLAGTINIDVGSMSVPLAATRGAYLSFEDGLVLNFSGRNSSRNCISATNGGVIGGYYNTSITINYNNVVVSNNIYNQYQGIVNFNGINVTWSGNISGKKYSLVACSILVGTGGNVPGSTTPSPSVDSTSYFS